MSEPKHDPIPEEQERRAIALAKMAAARMELDEVLDGFRRTRVPAWRTYGSWVTYALFGTVLFLARDEIPYPIWMVFLLLLFLHGHSMSVLDRLTRLAAAAHDLEKWRRRAEERDDYRAQASSASR